MTWKRPDDLQQAGGRVPPHDQFPVVRAEPVRDAARVRTLVETVLLEADRERVHRRGRRQGHERDHQAAVESAGEIGAQRHVADHPAADGLLEPRAQFRGLDREGPALADRLGARQFPVPTDGAVSVADGERVARRQLAHAAHDRPRRGDVHERQVLVEPFGIEFARDAAVRQDRLELRCEKEPRALP